MEKTIYRQSKVMGFDPKVINLVCIPLLFNLKLNGSKPKLSTAEHELGTAQPQPVQTLLPSSGLGEESSRAPKFCHTWPNLKLQLS